MIVFRDLYRVLLQCKPYPDIIRICTVTVQALRVSLCFARMLGLHQGLMMILNL